MASQPANATIQVFRRIRSQRDDARHEAIRNVLSPGLRALVMVVPGEEVLVNETLDAVVSDRFRFGHPVVRMPRGYTTFQEAVDGISGLAFPVQVGRDKFLESRTPGAAATTDIHQDLRDVE
jgi:hypothetical protein